MAECDELSAVENTLSYCRLEETQSVENVSDKQSAEKIKVPRRIIHFSDGVLEEYSTDEDEDLVDANVEHQVDTSVLTWPQWCKHYAVTGACKTLSAADYCGEKLAWFFGITSPKYQFAIDEYHRRMAEEQEDRGRQEREHEAERRRKTVEMANMEEATCTTHHNCSKNPPVAMDSSLTFKQDEASLPV